MLPGPLKPSQCMPGSESLISRLVNMFCLYCCSSPNEMPSRDLTLKCTFAMMQSHNLRRWVKKCSLGVRWQVPPISRGKGFAYHIKGSCLGFLLLLAARTANCHVRGTEACLNLSKSAAFRNGRRVKHQRKWKLPLMTAQKMGLIRQTVCPCVAVDIRGHDHQ